MARDDGGDDTKRVEGGKQQGPSGKRPDGRREPLSPSEVWKLIMGTYKVSLPYLLVFIAGILLATWILTELVF